ncbi:membrane protein insertion efficiency factor YidD [Candidatus Scalindua japonica]|uniref:membrane protein insertion efficiency factor YidD n=1 Tax=Candidatus Scalindua japonica TaxID=1284222 RepID=UPI000BDF35F2|nr:membrane protein insertion efficiency factor YidD [Candidatus Scalindua japonica]
MKYLIVKFIRTYQIILSPISRPSCRFYPTCSQYAVEAIEKKGIIVGLLKGIWRVVRCNPFGGSGYDPVK